MNVLSGMLLCVAGKVTCQCMKMKAFRSFETSGDVKLLDTQHNISDDQNPQLQRCGTQNLASIVKPLWNVMPCSLVDRVDHFEVTYCLRLLLSCRRKQQIPAIRWFLPTKLYGVKSGENVCPSIFIYVRA